MVFCNALCGSGGWDAESDFGPREGDSSIRDDQIKGGHLKNGLRLYREYPIF